MTSAPPGDPATPRRVLVTGAASGLGAALTAAFRARGDDVLATNIGGRDVRKTDAGSTVVGASEVRKADADATVVGASEVRKTDAGATDVGVVRLDVTSDDDWAAVRAAVEERWGGLDVLVNNAGVAGGGRIDVCTLDEWRWITEINLFGVVRGVATFTPMLKAQGSGHIVNVASLAGLVHPPGLASYNAVKAAVVALSETVGHELAPYGVRCSVVCPSYFRTNLAASIRGADTDVATKLGALVEKATITAEDVAAAVLAGMDAGEDVIVPDDPARLAVALKRDHPEDYAAEMRRTATRMKERAEPS